MNNHPTWEELDRQHKEELANDIERRPYRERNHLVGLLAAQAGWHITEAQDIPNHLLVIGNIHYSQISWHIPEADYDIFQDFERLSPDDPRVRWVQNTKMEEYRNLHEVTTLLLARSEEERPWKDLKEEPEYTHNPPGLLPYWERNHLVAYLAAMGGLNWHVRKDESFGSPVYWVYGEIGGEQVSWRLGPVATHLGEGFDLLPEGDPRVTWNNHTPEDVYATVRSEITRLVTSPRKAGS